MTGMGAGLTWGSALIEWTHHDDWSERHDARSLSCSPARARSSRAWAREIAEAEPEAMAVYDAGSKASGLDLRALCFSGSPRS